MIKKYKLIIDTYFEDKYDNSVTYNPKDEFITEDLNRVNDLIRRNLGHLDDVIIETDQNDKKDNLDEHKNQKVNEDKNKKSEENKDLLKDKNKDEFITEDLNRVNDLIRRNLGHLDDVIIETDQNDKKDNLDEHKNQKVNEEKNKKSEENKDLLKDKNKDERN